MQRSGAQNTINTLKNNKTETRHTFLFEKHEDIPQPIMHAVQNAVPGSFIVCCSDVVPDALAQVMKLKEEEDSAALSNFSNLSKGRELLAE